MPKPEEPMTETMNADDARAQWDRLLSQVFRRERRVLVQKDGIPVAAIVSAEDWGTLQHFERQRAEDFKALDRFAEAFKDESPEDIEREVAKAVASARAKRRARQRTAPNIA